MAPSKSPAVRTRGRPPNSDGQETANRLLDAAASACAEHGFDGATMNEIAARAGVTAAAIYNHFDSREELLYSAGVRGLRRVTEAIPQGLGADSAKAIAAAYLRPGLKETRRLLAELHLAGGRDPRLGRLLASWHRTWADALVRVLPPDDPAPEATVKALFLLLLGLCHMEDLAAVEAAPTDVAERVERLVDAIVPPRELAMVMSSTLIEEVKRRANAERARTAYPPGFPELPPVPAGRYGDAAFARLEQDAVFGRSWLMVAHSDELPAVGDYRLVDQLPQPIMLVRHHDGGVRAFYNTCRHRGAALLEEAAGHTGRRLTCPYHSWVYDLDGALVGYPDASSFTDLDRDCLSLAAVRCETWGPLVFINLDPDAGPLAEFLRPVSEDVSELGDLGGRLHLVDHGQLEVPVNWKIPVDANIETYHVNTVHRDSAARALDQSATGIQLLRNGHSRMLIRMHDGKSLAGLLPFPPLFEGLGDLPDAGTFSYHVFPNLSIVFSGPGFVFFITNWPDGPDRSTYHTHFCSSLPSDDDERAKTNLDFTAMNRSVLFEDLSVLPGMQRSVDAGAIDAIRLGYQERRIYHLHETIDRVIGSERVPERLLVVPVLGDHVEAQ